jgi:hypothetical protein
MKVKTSALLAVIGTVLLIISRAGALWYPFPSVESIITPNLVNILGYAFVIIFFIVFFKEHKNNALLKNAALLGLIGQIFYFIAYAAGMANIWLLKFYNANPEMHRGAIYIVSILSQAGYILRIAAIFLLCLFFMKFYRYLKHKSPLKTSVLLALIGEAVTFVIEIVIRILLYLLPRVSNGVTTSSSVSKAITIKLIIYIGNIIEFIPLIFLTIFFIVLYRGQGQIENSKDLQV